MTPHARFRLPALPRRFDLLVSFVVGLLLALGTGPACTPPASSDVLVTGDATDLRVMSGTWEGTYDAPDRGRSGSIHFELSATADSAVGVVVMFTRPPWPGHEATRGDEPTVAPPPPRARTLTISFVRVEGGRVAGRVDAYTDPECRCTLWTTFEGTLTAGAIRGVFVSHFADGTEAQRGTWAVTRP